MLIAFNGCGFNCRRFKDDEKFYGREMKTVIFEGRKKSAISPGN